MSKNNFKTYHAISILTVICARPALGPSSACLPAAYRWRCYSACSGGLSASAAIAANWPGWPRRHDAIAVVVLRTPCCVFQGWTSSSITILLNSNAPCSCLCTCEALRTDKIFMFVVIITCCCSDMPIVAKTEVTEIEKSKTGNYPVPSTKRKLHIRCSFYFYQWSKRFFFFHQNRSINIGSHTAAQIQYLY